MKLNGKLVYFLLSLIVMLLSWQGNSIVSNQKELSNKLEGFSLKISERVTKIETMVESHLVQTERNQNDYCPPN